MTRKPLLALALALTFAAAAAPAAHAASWTAPGLRSVALAPEPQPMTGEGENMKLVANVPMVGDETSPAASDIEPAGNYAFVGSYGEGMVVVDISAPTHPTRAGKFDCPGGQNDI